MSYKKNLLILLSLSLCCTLFLFRQEIQCSLSPQSIISIQNFPIKCSETDIDKKSFQGIGNAFSQNSVIFHDTKNIYFAYYNGLFYDIQHASPYSIGVFDSVWTNLWIHTQMGISTAYYVSISWGKITDVVNFPVASWFHFVWAETSSPNLGAYYADDNTLYYIYSDHWNSKIQQFVKKSPYSNIDLPPAQQHPNEIFTFADYVIKSWVIYPISNVEIEKNPIMWVEGIWEFYSFVERDFQIFWMDTQFVYDQNLNILEWLNPKSTVWIANGAIIIWDGKVFYEIGNGDITYNTPKKLKTTQNLINHYNFVLNVKNKS